MKVFCLDGKDLGGVGGALRGREMSFALHQLGHECIQHEPSSFVMRQIGEARDLDAVINTGTWHQLRGNTAYFVDMARECERRHIVCLWWYGSNGSVFGCVDPDPAIRAQTERSVIDLLCERKFIGVICPYSMDIYARHGVPREKMRLVPSVFDGDLFCPSSQNVYEQRISARLRHDWGIPADAFCLATVGHTPNSKGGDEVLRAVALLQKEMPDLYYLILHTPEANVSKRKATSADGKKIGNSEWDVLQDSKNLAVHLGLMSRVRFLGMRFPRVAMPTFYRMARVYCSPSKAENLGQPLVESQLCGLPLVTYQGFSFDFVACPETATQIAPHHTETDDYGLVIPFADPAVLAEGIRRARHMAEDAQTAARTRQWAYQKFHHHNAKVMIEALAEYKAMLNG